MLDHNDDVVLYDFAGSSSDRSKSTVAHSTRCERPHKNWDLPLTIPEELFALGSIIYEVWNAGQLHEDEEESVVE